MAEALIQLFKEQLENESKDIAVERALTKRGDYLIWWYFLRMAGLDESEIELSITDDFDDHGIDALRIDDDDIVHFYNFKNPTGLTDSFPSGEVDKLLSGLHLIIRGDLKNAGANAALKRQAAEITKLIPAGYRIHLVTSGVGLQQDIKVKLQSFIDGLGPSGDFWQWTLEDIHFLQSSFYAKSRPTVEDDYHYQPDMQPYSVRAAGHDSYMFTMPATALAGLYALHGEQLLQQNIRIGQGDSRGTNANIKKTASGDDSGNFLHYNNGVVFLAETAQYDNMTRKMTLRRYQVVNGGQTMRSLSAASLSGKLRADVMVPIRVITSGSDKDFASNVTVNLNNQNRIKDSFLRSNDPQVIQLAAALRTRGWYLERREREAAGFTATERAALEATIGGHTLAERTIELTLGLQAYVATYMGEPELAKRYPKKMFAAVEDLGAFEKVFKDITAEKLIAAHRLRAAIDAYVSGFVKLKRKNQGETPRRRNVAYREYLGNKLITHVKEVDTAIPPSTIFLLAAVFYQQVVVNAAIVDELIGVLDAGDYSILNDTMATIIEVRTALSDSKAWPSLLKSHTLFNEFIKRVGQPPKPMKRGTKGN